MKLLADIVIIAKILIGFKVTGNMKKRLLTLLFAFATVCGFAQEKSATARFERRDSILETLDLNERVYSISHRMYNPPRQCNNAPHTTQLRFQVLRSDLPCQWRCTRRVSVDKKCVTL